MVNGKKYIGQSRDIEKRWKEHAGAYKKSHISQAIGKYGIEKFKFEILRDFMEGGLTQVLLDLFERKYILEYNTMDRKYGYNKNTGGGSCGIVSDETKWKISKSKIGKPKPPDSIQRYREGTLRYFAAHGSPCTGIPRKEETKKKISIALSGKPWSESRKNSCVISEGLRKKLSVAHTGLKWSDARWAAYHKRYGMGHGK